MANYGLRIGALAGYPLTAEGGSYALSGQITGLTYTPAGGAEPYTWFTGFDKQDFPPHTSSGVWGAQSTVKEASAPTGAMTDVTAANAAELATHIYTPNRRITVTGNISATAFNGGNITDVDIILNSGVTMRDCYIGAGDGSTTITRLRLRGPTVGSYSGGKLHQVYFLGPSSGTSTDVILDGIALTGKAVGGFGCINVQGSWNRMAITNCRAISGGKFYTGDADNLTVTNCSILTGMDTAAESGGDEEAWGIRFEQLSAGNFIVYGCDIRSNPLRSVSSHYRVRAHPGSGVEYYWVDSNQFVERVESRILWCDAAAGGGSGNFLSTWFTNNNLVASSTGGILFPGIDVGTTGGTLDTAYAYLTGNTFQSNTYTSNSAVGSIAGSVNGTAGKGSNTYTTLPGSDPAWGAAGDPSGITWDI